VRLGFFDGGAKRAPQPSIDWLRRRRGEDGTDLSVGARRCELTQGRNQRQRVALVRGGLEQRTGCIAGTVTARIGQ
jgi:hypothetical protein